MMDTKQRNSLTCGAVTLGFILGLIAMGVAVILMTHLTVSVH